MKERIQWSTGKKYSVQRMEVSQALGYIILVLGCCSRIFWGSMMILEKQIKHIYQHKPSAGTSSPMMKELSM